MGNRCSLAFLTVCDLGPVEAIRVAAETGYDVVLVEREAALGGWPAKLWKRVPWKAPHAEPQDTGVTAMAALPPYVGGWMTRFTSFAM